MQIEYVIRDHRGTHRGGANTELAARVLLDDLFSRKERENLYLFLEEQKGGKWTRTEIARRVRSNRLPDVYADR